MRKLSLIMTTCLLTFTAGQVNADVITLKTTKPAGTELKLALNLGAKAELAWSNGEKTSLVASGQPQALTVKAEGLTITTENALTVFYMPSAGLSTLDVSGAPALQKLFCQDNALAELELEANTALKDIDCQGNKLAKLNLSKNTALEFVNCAQNELTSLSCNANSPIKVLVCSENQLATLPNVTKFTQAETLWANQNALTSLTLTSLKQLRTLNVSSNKLTTLTFAVMKNITDIWAENNKLTTLTMQHRTPALRVLSLDNNNLSRVTLDATSEETLERFYGHGNFLFFNSFPTTSGLEEAVLVPQRPFKFPDKLGHNLEFNQSSYVVATNGYGDKIAITQKFYTPDGTELKNAKETGDYYIRDDNYITFYKMFDEVTMKVTSKRFRNVELESESFQVTDPAGIHRVSADGLSLSVSKGSLGVTAEQPVALSVYDTAGRRVVGQQLGAGTYSYPLASGIYVVNGQKVLVP